MMGLKGGSKNVLFPCRKIVDLLPPCSVWLALGAVLSVAVCFSPSQGAARIVINEIYYDHPGSDAGHEFVEILNTGDQTVNLYGFSIEFIDGRTGNPETYYEFVNNVYLARGGMLIVGAVECAPVPDYIAMCPLQNGPDAVRLVSSGSVVDLAGYGDLDLSNLYESEPAVDVTGGYSLARKPDGKDSDNNSLDFVSAFPSPMRKNFFDIDFAITIINDDLFPCANDQVTMEFEIANSGLSAFSGGLVIWVVTYAGMEKIDNDISGNDSLRPGESINIEYSYFASGLSGSDSVFAFLDQENDENCKNDTTFVSFLFSPGDIVINEIMYRPHIDRSEWIELYNTGDREVNLQGYLFSDAVSTERLITSDPLVLCPGGYLILAQFPEKMKVIDSNSEFIIHGIEGGWPALNDYSTISSREEIVIREESGIIAEKIGYVDMMEGERGRSIERFSPFVCSSIEGGLWHRCSLAEGSTPGSANSVFNGNSGVIEKFTILPNPFSPQRDGKVMISGKAKTSDTGYLVRIFNMRGMEIVRLAGEKNGADYFSSFWDGIDSKGEKVVTGLYICVVEYYGMGGGVCRREKGCLAVKSGI